MRRLSNYHCRKLVWAMLEQWHSGCLHVMDSNGDTHDFCDSEVYEQRDRYNGMELLVSVLPDGDRKFIFELLWKIQERKQISFEAYREGLRSFRQEYA